MLRWRRSSRISTSASSAALVRLPLCAEADAVGRVDVERLRFGGAVATGRRIAHVADADVAAQVAACAAAGTRRAPGRRPCASTDAAFGGHDAGGILAAVLQHRQRVIERWLTGLVRRRCRRCHTRLREPSCAIPCTERRDVSRPEFYAPPPCCAAHLPCARRRVAVLSRATTARRSDAERAPI